MVPKPSRSGQGAGAPAASTLVAAVVIFQHLAGLWALHTHLLRPAAGPVIPVHLLAEFVERAVPQIEPLQAPSVAPPQPAKPAFRQKDWPGPQPVQRSLPPPVAMAPEPSVLAPAVSPSLLEPQTPAEPSVPAVPPASAERSATPGIEPPSSSASYLSNPPPTYPALSRRLGEQGNVVVRVLIGVDGAASKAEVQSTSGFERLDQAAVQTVLRWRYVPGKRAGVPEAMWFNVPIRFILD